MAFLYNIVGNIVGLFREDGRNFSCHFCFLNEQEDNSLDKNEGGEVKILRRERKVQSNCLRAWRSKQTENTVVLIL